MKTIKLTPRSSRGTKIIGALPSKPTHWNVIKALDEVSWSGMAGPWLQVYPDIPEGLSSIMLLTSTTTLTLWWSAHEVSINFLYLFFIEFIL